MSKNVKKMPQIQKVVWINLKADGRSSSLSLHPSVLIPSKGIKAGITLKKN
jgi:hypothetical protein